MLKKFLLGSAVCLLISGAAAHADTFTLTDSLGAKYALDYTNAGGGVYDIFLTIDTTKVTGATTLGDVAIKVASDDANLKLISAPSGYTLQDGGLSGGGCDGSGGGYFCFKGSTAVGGVLVFEASITDVPTSTGSIKDQFFNGSNKVEQLSDNTSIGTHTPSVAPEPSALVLLGTGILGIAGAVRRRVTVS